ncbi:MAG TPA: hypothetical protein VFH51_09625 [Myxococcota bacterium]|nr:hypothetical protein [Myxococcota bacterium]
MFDAIRPTEPGEILCSIQNSYLLSALVSRGAQTVMLQVGTTHLVLLREGRARVAVSLDQARLERRRCCESEVGVGSSGTSVALSPSGRFAVLDSAAARKWEFWDLRRRPLQFTVEHRPTTLGATPKLTFLDDESGFVATGAGQQVCVDFKPPSAPEPRFTWPAPSPWFSALRARVAEPMTCDGVRRLEGLASKPRSAVTHPDADGLLHFHPRHSPDGRWALDYSIREIGEARTAILFKVWDLTATSPQGRPLFTLRGRENVQDLAISNGAKTVLIRTFEQDFLFLRQGNPAGDLIYGTGELPDDVDKRSHWAGGGRRSVAVAPSGRLAVTHNDLTREAVVWDLSHGSAVSVSPAVKVPDLLTLSHMAFSPTEDSIALANEHGGVRIALSPAGAEDSEGADRE